MVDIAVILGYLGVAAGRAAGRLVDRKLDRGLDELVSRVRVQLRGDPAADLARDPSPDMERRIAGALERAARNDRQFGRDLADILGRLDRMGGRTVITNVQGVYMHHQGSGDMAYGGNIYKPYHAHPDDLSHAPVWVKALMAAGFLGFLSGIGILVVGAFNIPGGFNDVSQLDDMPSFGTAIGVVSGSFGVLFIANVIAMLTKPR